MSELPPLMRASHILSNLVELKTFGPELAAQIRAQIPAETVALVENSATVAWLPVEHDVLITRAVLEHVGIPGVRLWSQNAVLRSATGPLIRPLIDSARSVFGVTPHALFRLLPRALDLIYRNCGTTTYEKSGEFTCTILQTGLPHVLFTHRYLEGVAGAFQAIPILFGDKESAVRLEEGVAMRTARYFVNWER